MKIQFLKLALPVFFGLTFLTSCNQSNAQENVNQESVEIETPGNSEENTAEATVEPTPEPKKEVVDQEGMKYLYLTWDDGPNEGTANVIAAFKKHNLPITLFMIGRNIYQANNGKKHFEMTKNDPLFQLANHSYTHANNRYKTFYANPQGVLADFVKTSDSMKVDNRIGRTPGRNIWRTKNINSTDLKASTAAGDLLYENGFRMIGWDVEWNYNKQTHGVKQSAQEMMNIIDYAFNHKNSKIENHVVLLTHDQYFRDAYSIEQLDQFLSMLNERNDIEVRLLNDYPELRNNELH